MDAELWLSESGRGKDRWKVCMLSSTPVEVRQMAVGHLAAELESGNARAAVWLDNARLRPTAEELAAARAPYRRVEAQADAPREKPRKIAKPVSPPVEKPRKIARTLGERFRLDPPVRLGGPRPAPVLDNRTLRERLRGLHATVR